MKYLLLFGLYCLSGCAAKRTGNETAGITASLQTSRGAQVRAQAQSRKASGNLSTASDEAGALLKYLESPP